MCSSRRADRGRASRGLCFALNLERPAHTPRYRTGKSFFLNRLAGAVASAEKGGSSAERTGGSFGVGATTEPCTRGIWLWHAPWLKTRDGAQLLLMDTEGLASADQDARSPARRIFHDSRAECSSSFLGATECTRDRALATETAGNCESLSRRTRTTPRFSRSLCCSRVTSSSTPSASSTTPPSRPTSVTRPKGGESSEGTAWSLSRVTRLDITPVVAGFFQDTHTTHRPKSDDCGETAMKTGVYKKPRETNRDVLSSGESARDSDGASCIFNRGGARRDSRPLSCPSRGVVDTHTHTHTHTHMRSPR